MSAPPVARLANKINAFDGSDENWPGWPDMGRRISILVCGQVVTGKYSPDEAWDGYEAVTQHVVKDDAGVEHRMEDADEWQFADNVEDGELP